MDAAPLKDIPIFTNLSRRDRKVIAQHADEIDLKAGVQLTEAGRLATEVFVIVEGSADVFDGDEKINQLGPGDVIGEIGVMETTVRTASVVATSPLKAIVIYGRALKAMRDSVPEVYGRLQVLIQERLESDARRH